MRAVHALVAAAALAAGCASPSPTTLSTGKPGFVVSCNGTGRDWATCYSAATQACPNGFDTDGRELVVVGTVRRTLTFACK